MAEKILSPGVFTNEIDQSFLPATAGKLKNTSITREYSDEYSRGKTPYYPINDEKNGAMFKKYAALAAEQEGIIFGGRLAEYKYYDMHQVVAASLHNFSKINLTN